MLKHRIIAKGVELPKSHFNYEIPPETRQIMDQENLERSMRRTQSEIADLIDCNDFEWFGTFTFNRHKVNRYDHDEVYAKMSKFLNNARRKSTNLTYILVPEHHKDGALHFHALLGSFEGVLSDSGKKWADQPIYNLNDFSLGFTNFTKIRDKSRTANYCRKYITKELMQHRSKKRYWASKNLNKPLRIENLELLETIAKYHLDMNKVLTHFENDFATSITLTIKEKATENPEDGGFISNT